MLFSRLRNSITQQLLKSSTLYPISQKKQMRIKNKNFSKLFHTRTRRTFWRNMLKADREVYGPDFDDRLIKLVKENSAIYDVRHPHYRRTPVRMAIWDNIAKQLGAPSRFLQTKWKNIRYNYLQEQKCLETGTVNTNIRKRRFTEDLSFLKYTAYRRDGVTPSKPNCNEADDGFSFIKGENLTAANNIYEVIELDHSDDETEEFSPNISAFLAPMNDIPRNSPTDQYEKPDNTEDRYDMNKNNIKPHTSQEHVPKAFRSSSRSISPTNSHDSSRSSQLLTPLSTVTKNGDETKSFINSNSEFSEVTIQPITSTTVFKRQLNLSPNEHVLSNSARQKNMATTAQMNNDPIELYCLSLADCFRAMPRSERERVKYEFAKILKDAHYKDQL